MRQELRVLVCFFHSGDGGVWRRCSEFKLTALEFFGDSHRFLFLSECFHHHLE